MDDYQKYDMINGSDSNNSGGNSGGKSGCGWILCIIIIIFVVKILTAIGSN